MKNGHFRDKVTATRKVLVEQGERVYREVKKTLPAVNVNGRITGKRKHCGSEGRIEPSGIIQADIDGKDNPGVSVEEVKRRCIDSGLCVSVFTSPSGSGVKALCRIKPDPGMHSANFRGVKRAFGGIGLVLDDIADEERLMFVCDDPELWVSLVLPEEIEPVAEKQSRPKVQKLMPDYRVRQVVEAALFVIPPNPPYQKWFRISCAVIEILGPKEGILLLIAWSPEHKEGEYEKLYRPDYQGPKVGLRTLLKIAEEHGYVRGVTVPPDVIPVPRGGISHVQSSSIIFQEIAAKGGYYNRSGRMVKVKVDDCGGPCVEEVKPEQLVEVVEGLGKRVACRQVSKDGDSGSRVVWRSCTLPIQAAKVALNSEEISKRLPALRQVTNCPVMVADGATGCKTLGEGYHPEGGGIFVAGGIELVEWPHLHVCGKALFDKLLGDFDFASPSDRSRAVAAFLSPVIQLGGFGRFDVPINIVEADRSQSRKTYLHRCVAALFNEAPSVITPRTSGVGSLDESVANALHKGGRFICIDNCRGVIDSQLLESAIRGHGHVLARGFRSCGNVDTTGVVWQLTTNGAMLTGDLANRASIVRIKKRPADYRFREFPEGDMISHIEASRGGYLSIVFAMIEEWCRLGRPATAESRHDFREWAGGLDWIVQNLCGCAPLLDGHRVLQERNSDHSLQWLREVVLATPVDRHGKPLRASDLAAICEGAGLELPGPGSNEKVAVRIGKIMSRLFSGASSEDLTVDGFSVRRERRNVAGPNGGRETSFYIVSPI
jgi:hypothetical protein